MNDHQRRATGGWAVLLFCGLLPMSVSHAATYHVAPNKSSASDRNDGLASIRIAKQRGPWKTLGKAASTVRAGDTILLYDGDYRQEPSGWGTGKIALTESGTPDKPITLHAARGQRPLLRTCLIHDQQWIVLRGLTFENPGRKKFCCLPNRRDRHRRERLHR